MWSDQAPVYALWPELSFETVFANVYVQQPVTCGRRPNEDARSPPLYEDHLSPLKFHEMAPGYFSGAGNDLWQDILLPGKMGRNMLNQEQ